MTDKPDRLCTDPGLTPIEPSGPSTLRSLEPAEDAAASPNAPVYYEPLPLVAVSNHKTLEIETVKLAEDIDPRKLVTELRLHRAAAFAPASDSGWPPETALSSSQPPAAPARRWRTPVLLLSLLAALLLLVLARAVSRSSPTPAVRAASAPLASKAWVMAPAAIPSTVAPDAPAASVVPFVSAPASASAARMTVATPSEAPRPALVPQHSAKQNPQHSAPSQSLAAPSGSPAKRAIY